MPPSAADGGSSDQREYSSNTEDECRRLPPTCPLLLLNGEVLLNIQTMLFLGELLLGGNSSLPFFSRVAEQGMGCLSGGEEGRGHEHDADKGFHISLPFLEMGTKNPAPLENRKLCWG